MYIFNKRVNNKDRIVQKCFEKASTKKIHLSDNTHDAIYEIKKDRSCSCAELTAGNACLICFPNQFK